MSLYAKILKLETPAVPANQLLWIIEEVLDQGLSAVNAGNVMGLTAAERQQVSDLIARVTGGQLTREEIMRVCGIAQWRRNTTLYKTEAALKARLGVS